MKTLIALILLPLCVIAVQLALELQGVVGYSIYKLFLLIPPIVYCRLKGISIVGDIFKPGNWQNRLTLAVGLGAAAVLIFWGAYWLLGDMLLDKDAIASRECFRNGGCIRRLWSCG